MPYTSENYEVILLIIAVIVVLVFLGMTFLVMISYYNARKRKMLQEKKDMQSSFQNTLLQTRLEIQEETFKTLSQEIHDNIGQALSFIKLSINTIDVAEQETAKEKLVESKQLLTKVIQDLRDLSRTLNPDFINEIGLVQAIDQQVVFLNKSGLYKVDLQVNGSAEKYPLQNELVVFRIVQELLNNIVKHADAHAITIVMDYQLEQLAITVTDDGKGFDTLALQAETNTGLGLRNMVNRMQLIKGAIDINSSPGNGTQAFISVPKNIESSTD
jgi:signal transduction histidine kinase